MFFIFGLLLPSFGDPVGAFPALDYRDDYIIILIGGSHPPHYRSVKIVDFLVLAVLVMLVIHSLDIIIQAVYLKQNHFYVTLSLKNPTLLCTMSHRYCTWA